MSGGAQESQPTYYQLLQIPRNNQPINPESLKVAYRRALLIHHPDKKCSSRQTSTSPAKQLDYAYSVDQITNAYKTLSCAATRAEYDKRLQDDSKRLNSKSHDTHHAGIETFDLEELKYNEETNTWSRRCRCGEETGYDLTESDLEKETQHGEVYIACKGCSLSIRVLFEAAPLGGNAGDECKTTLPA